MNMCSKDWILIKLFSDQFNLKRGLRLCKYHWYMNPNIVSKPTNLKKV